MTIAFDVSTIAVEYVSIGSQTVNHVASASARAAVVLIDQNTTATDEVTSVTYGGIAMTRLSFNTEATEPGAVYIYWLDNIATGTQNVVMTTSAATSKQLVVATMTVASGGGVKVAGNNFATSVSAANPAVTISGFVSGIRVSAFEVIHSGLQTMTTTPATGWTRISSTDLGAQGRGFARQDVTINGNTLTAGWTAATADDYVIATVAFREVVMPFPWSLGTSGALFLHLGADNITDTTPNALMSGWNNDANGERLDTVGGVAPVYRSSGGPNTKPFVDHTAVNGSGGFYNSSVTPTPTTAFTFYAVVKLPDATAVQSLVTGAAAYNALIRINSGKIEVVATGVAVVAASATLTLPINQWFILMVAYQSGSVDYYVDDLTEHGTPGAYAFSSATSGMTYGESYKATATEKYKGQTAEIGMYRERLSDPNILTLKNYLKTKYALPVVVLTPPSPPASVAVLVDSLFITLPAALPGTSTSLSLYENGVKIAGLLAVNAVFTVSPRDASVTYSYTARGDGPSGETGDSTAIVATPDPSPPTGLTAVGGDGQITLSWNAKSYSGTWYSQLFRDGTQIAYGPIPTTFVDTGLTVGSSHIYQVRSVVFNPGRYSVLGPDVGAVTTSPIVVRNPNLVSDVGGPSYSTNREDMLDDPRTVTHQRALRTTSAPWSDAERIFAALEFLPPQWLAWLAGPSRNYGSDQVFASDPGARLYFENYNVRGPFWNFAPQYARVGGLWWTTPYNDIAIWINTVPTGYERQLIHEVSHHVNHIVRPIVGLDRLYAGQPVSPGLTLAGEFVAAVLTTDLANTVQHWQGTNADEMVAESYTALIVANADPSYLIVAPNADYPAGIRADQWILKMCGNNADLTSRWTTELTKPAIWPAAAWPVSRTMATQATVDRHRNTIALPIQNLDSNEGPMLLLADATNGYRAATTPVAQYLSKWGRSDRPLTVLTSSKLLVGTGLPTVEVRNTEVPAATDAISTVQLLDGPSEQWRTTITFRVGELLAVDSILWQAKETLSGPVETEYAITWNGATVSASLTRRVGTGGAVIDTTKVTSGNVLVVGERCTVQAVWGAQGAPITLRHRTASAGSVTTLTSAAMPTGRLAVKYWSMPIPHANNGATLSYCALAAVSVETVHDGGVGPMTWMDAEYA